MKQKVFLLVALIILAFTVVTCTAGSGPSSSSNSSLQTASPTEEFPEEVVTSNPSETNNQPVPNTQESEEEQIPSSTNTPNSNQEDPKPEDECAFRYSLLFNSEDSDKLALTCAVAFETKGKVFLTQGKGKKELVVAEPPKVLRERSILETEGDLSSAELLFDTFDWVKASRKFNFSFRLVSEDLSTDPSIEEQGDFQLDIGKMLVGSLRPTKPDSRDESIISSVNKEGRSNSFSIARLWQWGVNRLKSISFVSFINGLFAQKALAVGVNNTSTLGKPALTTKTAEATVESNLAVYVVNRDAERKETQVFSLTDEPIRVTDQSGKVIELRRNQTVVATEIGFNGDQFEYRLCRFYKDNPELLEGLAPNEEGIVMQKPLPLQMSYRAARSLMMNLYNKNCQRPCPQPGS
jgi:hypothetical protein